MLAGIFAHAQENVPPYVGGDAEVTPPKFVARKYAPTDKTNSLKAYIAENLAYDADVGEVMEGTEVVKFIINADGSLSEIEVVNSVSPTVDKLITGILEETDYMWMPGKNNGVAVAMEKEIAIQIKLGLTESTAESRDFKEIAKEHFNKGAEKLFVDRKAKRAIKHFETVIRYQPYDQSTVYLLALCEVDRGNMDAAQEYADRFMDMGGDKSFLEETLAEEIKGTDAYEQLTQLFATK